MNKVKTQKSKAKNRTVPILSFTFLLLFFSLPSFAQEDTPLPASLAVSQNVTLDFKEADIQNVLKIISYKSGVNIVTTPEVIGNVTIRLEDVPWEKALDTIMKTSSFGYEWLGDKIIMVSTLERLAKRRKDQQDIVDLEPLNTEAFVLNFSAANDIKGSVEKLISVKGKITLESRTNTLIITDTDSNLAKIREIIKGLDKITPQVTIEARIIETSLGSTEKLGIDWSTIIKVTGSKRPTFFPFIDDKIGKSTTMFPSVLAPDQLEIVNTVETSSTGASTTSKEEKLWNDLRPGFPAVSASQFTFGTLDFTGIQMVLEFLKTRSDTKIISNPRITTLNNTKATMFVGRVVPIATYEYSKETGTQIISGYKDQQIGITLTVTPNINEKKYITLYVNPKIEEIVGATGPNGERPVFSSRSAETNVMIKDGQTLIIGGLISENKRKSKRRIPIIGELPILDMIFGSKGNNVDRTELLILITPHIINDAVSVPEDLVKIDELEKEKEAAAVKKKN